jgi:hypothetical protein
MDNSRKTAGWLWPRLQLGAGLFGWCLMAQPNQVTMLTDTTLRACFWSLALAAVVVVGVSGLVAEIKAAQKA